MTDTELDAVSARGTGTDGDGTFIDLGGLLAQISPDGNEVSFAFDAGNLLGNGSMVATAPSATNPSMFSFAGLGSGQPIFFEN